MYQYDDPTCVAALPTPAALGAAGYFSNGNPTTGLGATVLTADYMNMVMLELLNVVKAGGISPSKTTYDQVLSALKRIGQNTIVLADTGIANAYSAANPSPLVTSTWGDGVVQAVKIAHTNTGASTYSPDGLAAIPIYGLGLQPLQGGELVAGATAVLVHSTIPGVNSGNPICVLMMCPGGAQQLATGSYATSPIQFDSTTKLATTSWVHNEGLFVSSINSMGANGAIAASAAGAMVTLGSTMTAATLPAAGSVRAGTMLPLLNVTSGGNAVVVSANGNDTIFIGNAAVSSYSHGYTESAVLVSNGSNQWILVFGSMLLSKSYSMFGASLANTGYQKLPSGLIIQWGVLSTGSSGTATGNFPLAFPNGPLQMVAGVAEGAANGFSSGAQALSSTAYQVFGTNYSGGGIANIGVSWIALGR